MNTTTRRFLALPLLTAGIAAAALGFAGAACAAPTHTTDVTTHAGTTAHPANEQAPGWHNHHGPQHIHQLEK
jgi:hypothetical protein